MAAAMGESGDRHADERNVAINEQGSIRVNGELNGSLDEPMEVSFESEDPRFGLKGSNDGLSEKCIQDVDQLLDNSRAKDGSSSESASGSCEKVPNSDQTSVNRTTVSEVPVSHLHEVSECAREYSNVMDISGDRKDDIQENTDSLDDDYSSDISDTSKTNTAVIKKSMQQENSECEDSGDELEHSEIENNNATSSRSSFNEGYESYQNHLSGKDSKDAFSEPERSNDSDSIQESHKEHVKSPSHLFSGTSEVAISNNSEKEDSKDINNQSDYVELLECKQKVEKPGELENKLSQDDGSENLTPAILKNDSQMEFEESVRQVNFNKDASYSMSRILASKTETGDRNVRKQEHLSNAVSQELNSNLESNIEENLEKSQESENDVLDSSIRSIENGDELDQTESKSGESPGKIKKSRKSIVLSNIVPRRSSRNLNKQKSYAEKEEDPEIQEIQPVDPLADPLSGDPLRDDKENGKIHRSSKTTIVVNDTKHLVEIAAGSKNIKGNKKEPTLVIIDTNSILSGRGPVPVSQTSGLSSSLPSSSNNSFSVLPVAVPAQGMYPPMRMPSPVLSTQPTPRQPQILPSLTDDMYVVEAPSFIVPYVYEKPPVKPLKDYVDKVNKDVKEIKEKSDLEEKSSSEAEKKEPSSEDNSKEGKKFELSSSKENVTPKSKDDSLSEEKRNLSSSEDKVGITEKSQVSHDDKEKKFEKSDDDKNKPSNYFDNPLGKFFMQIGVNLVQEFVQTDLLRSQKRKREREGGKGGFETQFAINSLLKNLEFSKENNEPFHLEQKKCEYCSFKTESSLVMAQHLETPHMRNYVYRCNFCTLEVRSPHDILFHMEAKHNVRGRLERAPAFHQCPNCPFEDNQKGKLSRHLLSCTKKFRPERNQEPPPDWEPPAKIPRVSRHRPNPLGIGAAAYQAMAGKQNVQHPLLPKLVPGSTLSPTGGMGRGRGRPPLHGRFMPDLKVPPPPRAIAPTQVRQSMMYRPHGSPSQPPVLLPAAYQLSGNQIYQVVGNQGQMMPMMPGNIPPVPRLTLMPQNSSNSSSVPTPVALVPNIAGGNNSITIQSATSKNPAAKLLQQPSISITPLPRQPSSGNSSNQLHSKHTGHASGAGHPSGKATFVICEICDGYIKDLEQLRNHMQWIHKVKIHPKMIYNRPPLNCQKCQFRFFTDQGLERHLLGSHGLVTSSMQEASNKGKDGGRCPVCGRVYQWKLLNHVARDHNMSLKPAHLSYKCTVCTATFGMYKQFENHVYSAHSVVAKRVMDKKTPQISRPQSNDALLKPLKINDEITIIPQPARPRPGPASRTGAISAAMQLKNEKVNACEMCEATFDGSMGFTHYISHIKRRHLQRVSVKLCRLEDCPTCKRRYVTEDLLDIIEDNKAVTDVIELSDDEVVIAGQGRNEITITKVPCAPGPKRFKQRLQQRHNVQIINIEDSPIKNSCNNENSISQENGEDSLNAVKERLRRRKSLEISQVDSECSSPHSSDEVPAKKMRFNEDE